MKIQTSGYDDNYRSSEERAAAARAELYATLKARGSLGVYYRMYPDEAPPGYWDRKEDRGRER